MIDFDVWRASYPTSTVAEQQAFYSQVWHEYPEQQHYDADTVVRLIELHGVRTVVELGGWDGGLAADMLDRFPSQLDRWLNVEICREAAESRGPVDRYEALCPDEWFWNMGTWLADMFVASHTIEHLTPQQFAATIAAIDVQVVYLDAPLNDSKQSWWGTPTTHINDMSWPGVDKVCATRGYRLVERFKRTLPPSSGDWSFVSVYQKADS